MTDEYAKAIDVDDPSLMHLMDSIDMCFEEESDDVNQIEANAEEQATNAQNTAEESKPQAEVNIQNVPEPQNVQSVQETQQETDKESEAEAHPYQYLIETFEPPKELLNFTVVGNVKTLAETPMHLVNKRQDLIKMLQTIRSAKEIAIDFQFSYNQYDIIVCLLEISTKDVDYIIDAIELRNELLLLTEILINPKIVKIIHKSDHILSVLQNSLCLYIVNMFDIDKAIAAFTGLRAVAVFASIKNLYQFERDNACSQKDFSYRPISEPLLKYCRSLPHYLVYLYHEYKNKLLEKDVQLYKNLLQEFRNDSKVVQLTIKASLLKSLQYELNKWQQCELDVLRKLYKWRNEFAKKNNKDPDHVLTTADMMALATRLPYQEEMVQNTTFSSYLRDPIERSVVTKLILEAREQNQISNKKPRDLKPPPYIVRHKRLREDTPASSTPKKNKLEVPQMQHKPRDNRKRKPRMPGFNMPNTVNNRPAPFSSGNSNTLSLDIATAVISNLLSKANNSVLLNSANVAPPQNAPVFSGSRFQPPAQSTFEAPPVQSTFNARQNRFDDRPAELMGTRGTNNFGNNAQKRHGGNSNFRGRREANNSELSGSGGANAFGDNSNFRPRRDANNFGTSNNMFNSNFGDPNDMYNGATQLQRARDNLVGQMRNSRNSRDDGRNNRYLEDVDEKINCLEKTVSHVQAPRNYRDTRDVWRKRH